MSPFHPYSGQGDAPGFDLYLRTIGRRPLLTAAQERALGRRVRSGAAQARNELVESNLRLVVRVAGRFLGRGLELPDLVAEGNLGLIRAAEKFNPDAGCRFSTYAVWWIMQSIRRAIERAQLVAVPADMRAHANAWLAAAQEIERHLGRPAADLEVARRLQTSRTRCNSVRAALLVRRARQVSVEAARWADGRSLRDVLPDQSTDEARDDADQLARQQEVQGLLAQLDPRSVRILQLRFGLDGSEPLTLHQTGAIVGLTRERVRQIRRNPLQQLAEAARPAAVARPRHARPERAA
jgi:RNA polymerase primary sigma factor